MIALPTPEAVVPIFGLVMENLRQREYRRSELSLQQLRLLSATSALAMGVAIRYKTDGQEMERVSVTYLLHKGDSGWKFAVMALHDTEQGRVEQLVVAVGTAVRVCTRYVRSATRFLEVD